MNVQPGRTAPALRWGLGGLLGVALCILLGSGSAPAPIAGPPPRRTRPSTASQLVHRAKKPAGTLGRTSSQSSQLADGAHTGMTQVTTNVIVGHTERHYVVFTPSSPVARRVPALVVLHGRDVSLGLEEDRDGLLPLADQGKAVVVYPEGIRRSWNAGACCGAAQLAGVDDVAFLSEVLHRFATDPRVSGVYLAGFSNGGRMAYRMVCAAPSLVRAFVVVDAVPALDCPPGRPVSLLQLDGTVDPIVAYDSSVDPHVTNGFVEPSATDAVAAWAKRDGCSGQVASHALGELQLAVWSQCSPGTTVQFGTYEGTGHGWPQGGPDTPSGADVLWTFVTSPGSQPAVGAVPPRALPVGASSAALPESSSSS
ncbi:MAG TPA: hypothetical protein VFW71_03675 [Actinomycetota bacterium]|nr:hypothetical protein [Actinomycetota bacterium]